MTTQTSTAATTTTPPPGTTEGTAGAGATSTPAAATVLGGAPAVSGTGDKPQTEATTTTTEGDAAKAKQTAPADIELKLPEGMQTGAKALEDFKALAKEHGLSSKQAQALVDFQAAQNRAVMEGYQHEQKAMVEAARSDREFGGAAFEANLEIAKKAVMRFGGEALIKRLNETGLGNDPAFIRAFYKAGKDIAEDSVAGSSGSTASAQRTHEDGLKLLYPTNFPKKE